MRRLIVCCAAIVVCVTSAFAQPHLLLPAEHNWGVVVPPGMSATQHQVHARIEVMNDGTAPLKISEIRVGCGCTSAPIEKDTLEPGEKTYLNVTLNLPNGNGPLTKYITFFTNEPTDSVHLLNLKADVQRPLQLSSGLIAFNAATVGVETQGIITLVSYNEEPVEVSVTPQVPGMTVEPSTTFTIRKGETKNLTFRFTPKAAGAYNVQAVLRATLPGYEDVPIVGYGNADEKK